MSETVNAELPQSSICITLYSHGDTTYHWAIVAPIDRYYAAKFHATNRGSAGWLYKPWQYKSVDEVLSSSRTAVVVVKIELGSNTIDALNSLLKDIPMTITNPEEADEPFGTKVWVRQAIRALHHARIIHCPDARKLEAEVLGYADANDEDIIHGKGGFKIHVAVSST
ncbi:unnamed protein product [Somion occarium]|uniref:HIRAN domain-containing protein n=1 Tax=Somion occarium TaxID=3059160 RepID=A0ABP1CRD4_9APHY